MCRPRPSVGNRFPVVLSFPLSNGRAIESRWANERKAEELFHWLSTRTREKPAIFFPARNDTSAAAFVEGRQTVIWPRRAGSTASPQLQSNPVFECEFACACWRCSECVCVSVNLKIEKFPDATATATIAEWHYETSQNYKQFQCTFYWTVELIIPLQVYTI